MERFENMGLFRANNGILGAKRAILERYIS
jgi:hypothetical protein